MLSHPEIYKLDTEGWVTLRFFEFTPDGIPRFPVAIDFHNGRLD